jgi:hypothetical protein
MSYLLLYLQRKFSLAITKGGKKHLKGEVQASELLSAKKDRTALPCFLRSLMDETLTK